MFDQALSQTHQHSPANSQALRKDQDPFADFEMDLNCSMTAEFFAFAQSEEIEE